MTADNVDLIIVGAGPTGLLLACRMIRLGKRVLVLEKDERLPIAVRALGYYGATQYCLRNAGIFQEAAEQGFFQTAFAWRKLTRQLDNGEKTWGDVIAEWNPWEDSPLELGQCGYGMLTLGQDQLRDICLQKLRESDLAQVLLGHPVVGLTQDETSATVTTVSASAGKEQFTAPFVVGADGGKSSVRKLLGLSLEGFTWPKMLVGVDLFISIEPPTDSSALIYILDRQDIGFFCPLSKPRPGVPSLWRFTLPMLPEECEPGVFDAKLKEKIELFVPGPRPLSYEIRNAQQYRTHQRQVKDYLNGRVLLIGDAAHLNSPTGGLGLTTGLLDADSLADAFELYAGEDPNSSILRVWADKRHAVWADVVSPMSSENQQRFYNADPENPRGDPFLRMVIDRTDELKEANKLFDLEMVTRLKEVTA